MFDLCVFYPSSETEEDEVVDFLIDRIDGFFSAFPDGVVHIYGPLSDLAKGVK